MDKALPDELPGIDMADALARLRGKKDALRRFLVDFRDRHIGAAQRLETMLQQGQWDDAARLAHTLKGSGGNLGAKRLWREASTLEQACLRTETAAAAASLVAVRDSLRELMDGLAQLGSAQDVASEKTVSSKDVGPRP